MASLENWQAWRKTCALALCTDSAQRDLRGFAFEKFRRRLQKMPLALAAPAATEAWHAFETHLALGKTRTAKAWKQWLFARGGTNPTLDCIQAGATLIMRDVVREYLRREHAPSWIKSLDAPVARNNSADATNAYTAADLLPEAADPLETLDTHEHQKLAQELQASAGKLLSVRHTISLTVYHNGKALYHPSVLAVASCSKSSLCNALHQALKILATLVNTKLANDCQHTRMHVAAALIEFICKNTLQLLETSHPELFLYIKED